MKSHALYPFVFLLALLPACNSDDPDPREFFIGVYTIENFTTTMAFDSEETLYNVNTNPEIEFLWKNDLEHNELKAELKAFINDVIQETFGKIVDTDASLVINLIDDETAEISGSVFEINELDFTITITNGEQSDVLWSEFSGKGNLSGDSLTMDFEIVIFTGNSSNFIFTGKVKGERD